MLGQVLRALSLAAGVIVLVAGSVGSSSALPVSSGLRHQGNASGSPIQKVHGWHCRRRYGWVRHCHRRYCHTHKKWHRHRGACYRGYYYGPSIYIGPSYYPRRYRRYRGYRRYRRYRRHRRYRRYRAPRRHYRRHRVIRRGGGRITRKSYPFPVRDTVRGRARSGGRRSQRPDP